MTKFRMAVRASLPFAYSLLIVLFIVLAFLILCLSVCLACIVFHVSVFVANKRL